MSRILVGTCSWTDPSLIECGRFYPPPVRSAADRLRFYAARFRLVEVDAAADTLATLEDAGLAYVSVDEPQGFRSSTPPLAAATAGLAYVRLHGRNADTWEARTARSAERAGTVHVLFNNNFEDWGLRNARRMGQLLGVEGGAGDDAEGSDPASQTTLDVDGGGASTSRI